MLRNELVGKLQALHAKMAGLKDAELAAAKAEFDVIKDEVSRMDYIVAREAELSHAKETSDTELMTVFGKLMRGEEVGGVGREALAVREGGLKDKAGKDAFRAPGDARIYLAARTVSVPVISSDSGPLPLTPFPNLAATIQLPLPPTPLFDRATKVAAINGVAVPFLVQSAQDPFAGVTMTYNNGEGTDKDDAGAPITDKLTITTKEYEGYTIMSDLALRRCPEYAGLISTIFRGALAYTVERQIMIALQANGDVISKARDTANQVGRLDLIKLKYAAPWYWNVNGEFGMSQTAAAYLEGITTGSQGNPLFAPDGSAPMFSRLVGKSWFLGGFNPLGASGDVFFGDFRTIYVGVGQDIVFRRTSEGLTLGKANSTAFFCFAHMGIGIPVGGVLAKLDDDTITTVAPSTVPTNPPTTLATTPAPTTLT